MSEVKDDGLQPVEPVETDHAVVVAPPPEAVTVDESQAVEAEPVEDEAVVEPEAEELPHHSHPMFDSLKDWVRAELRLHVYDGASEETRRRDNP